MRRPRIDSLIDDRTADRLLSGHLAPEDAPPGLAGVAAFAQAASSAPAPGGDHTPLVAAMADAVGYGAPLTKIGRTKMITKRVTAKVAAATAVGVLSIGTAAAAAAGALPGQSSGSASIHATVAGSATHGKPTTTTTSTPAAPSTPHGSTPPGSIPQTGPANVHAQFGLCTAFLAHNPTSTSSTTSPPPANSATPFRALIAQNGSVAATVTYCTGVVKNGPTTGSDSTESPDTGKPAGAGKPAVTGKPSDTGKPAGAGKPAVTGKPSDVGRPAGAGEPATGS